VFLQQLHSARQEGFCVTLSRGCGENGTCVLGLKGGGEHVSVSARGNGSWRNSTRSHLDHQVVDGLAATIRDFRVTPDGAIIGTLRAE
jgi:hypothetical protein